MRSTRISSRREVEAREHRRVPGRERRERGSCGDDEPDLVPVVHGADGVEHLVPLVLAPRQERQQHADTEVEALEQQVPAPEHGHEHEPEILRDPS